MTRIYSMHFLKSKNGIDTHFHVFHAGQAVEGARYVPQYSALLSDWRLQAQSAGVGRGVLIQPSFLGSDNRLMVSALKAHPDMLRGVAVVRPQARAEELQQLHEAGVRGIRLNLAGATHDIPEWTGADQVWDAMRALGWHLQVHTDQGGLPQVLNQLPTDLCLVVDHMGKPHSATPSDPSLSALIRNAQKATLYVKLSGHYRLGAVSAATVAKILLNELGPSALLWGSDWPCTNFERFADYPSLMGTTQEWIDTACLEQVMVSNPMRLYWQDRLDIEPTSHQPSISPRM